MTWTTTEYNFDTLQWSWEATRSFPLFNKEFYLKAILIPKGNDFCFYLDINGSIVYINLIQNSLDKAKQYAEGYIQGLIEQGIEELTEAIKKN